MFIYGVSYHQCLLNKSQEESSETGINRRYKNCLPKQHYLFFYYIYGLLPIHQLAAQPHDHIIASLLATQLPVELPVLAYTLLDLQRVITQAHLLLPAQQLQVATQPLAQLRPTVRKELGLLVAALQVASPLGRPGHDLFPPVLHRDEDILDQNHVLLLAVVLELVAQGVKSNHFGPVFGDVLLHHLVVPDLCVDVGKNLGHGFVHVELLFGVC